MEEGRRGEVVDKTVFNQVDNHPMVVNQGLNQGVNQGASQGGAGQLVVDNQRMVLVDQRVGGGGEGGGVAGHQGHHQAGQAGGVVENQQGGRSVENSAEFGDVAQYRELNAIGTGQ